MNHYRFRFLGIGLILLAAIFLGSKVFFVNPSEGSSQTFNQKSHVEKRSSLSAHAFNSARAQMTLEEAIARIRELSTGDPDEFSDYLSQLFMADESLALQALHQYGEMLPLTDYVTRAVYEYYKKFPILEGIERYKILKESQPDVYELTTLDYMSTHAASSPPEKVIEFFLNPENERITLKRSVIVAGQMVKSDSFKAIELIEQIEDEDLKYEMKESALYQWVISDVETAAEYLQNIEPAPWADQAISRLIYEHGVEYPEEVSTWLDAIYDEENRNQLKRAIASFKKDLEEALPLEGEDESTL